MPAPKRPSFHQMNAACSDWNAKNPVGTLVSFESIKGQGETHRGKSTTEAQVMGGHSAVIWLEGKSGCVALDHCTAVEQKSTVAADAAVPAPAAPDADKLMEDLFSKLEGLESDADAVPILIANADTLRTIAAAYRETGLFKRASDQYAEFKAAIESDTPPEGRLLHAWQWLLNRLAGAPTSYHVVAVIRLCLPLVADYLPEEVPST